MIDETMNPTQVDYSTRNGNHGAYCGCRECIEWHRSKIVELQIKYEGRMREFRQTQDDLQQAFVRIDELKDLVTKYKELADARGDAIDMQKNRCRKCQGTGSLRRSWNNDYIDCDACGGRGY